MIERVNMTVKSDEEWRRDLALSFRNAATATDNQLIKDWYEREAASLESHDSV